MSVTEHKLDYLNFYVGLAGAIGTIAALSFAIWLGWAEARRFRSDALIRDAERREEEQRHLQSQASCISAVATVTDKTEGVYHLDDMKAHRDTGHHATVDVKNASSLPIYGCKVVVEKDGRTIAHDYGFIPGGSTEHRHIGQVDDGRLNKKPVDVAFRDSAGIWWLRHADGQLHQQASDPYPRNDT